MSVKGVISLLYIHEQDEADWISREILRLVLTRYFTWDLNRMSYEEQEIAMTDHASVTQDCVAWRPDNSFSSVLKSSV